MLRERKRNRLKGFDYSRNALYFVTSCVKDRVCCFGTVQDGIMRLNENGTIATKQWHWLAEQYPYVRLHAFVTMPDHIHGIIEINRGLIDIGIAKGLDCGSGSGRDLTRRRPKIKSLSELMGAYKTTVSKQIRLAGFSGFAWQRSFHERIIRDAKAFERIRNYILNNPVQWEKDKFDNK